jgi:hypothetical protein
MGGLTIFMRALLDVIIDHCQMLIVLPSRVQANVDC